MAISVALSAAVLVLIGVLLTRRPREQSFTVAVAVAAPSAEQVTGLAARSAEFLAVLRDRGLDLNAPRQIDLHFVANTERSAKELMRSLRSEFPSDPADSMRPPWRVTCVVEAPVSAIVQPPAIEHRVRVATSVGAVHDGWGTAVETR